MRILILNTDYPDFLRHHYAAHPELADAPYDVQMAARNATLFGAADFYSKGFVANGCDAKEIHANNEHMQRAWAREHGLQLAPPGNALLSKASVIRRGVSFFRRHVLGQRTKPVPDWFLPVLAAQIADYAPDVILNQDMYMIPPGFLKRQHPRAKLIVGQIAAPRSEGMDLQAYDLLISSLPNLVARFEQLGVPAAYSRLGFDACVLDLVPPAPQKDIDVLFIGNFSAAHQRRTQLLEAVSRNVRLQIHGLIGPGIAEESPLRAITSPPAWGKDMYALLGRAKIVLNVHIDMAENFANNLRLFEATGMGALLVTDRKSNLADLFKPKEEVIDYATVEACVLAIRHYLEQGAEREKIAAAGQNRCLSSHTYTNNTRDLVDVFRAQIRG
jgi:spore maturation protein CgeB